MPEIIYILAGNKWQPKSKRIIFVSNTRLRFDQTATDSFGLQTFNTVRAIII